jgi:hypothetical protein
MPDHDRSATTARTAVVCSFAAVLVMALSRGPSVAHLLDPAATILYAVSLATWFAVVAPMNAVLAQWEPGAVPETFEAVRDRWEAGHIAISAIKFVGLGCLIAAALSLGRRGQCAARQEAGTRATGPVA